MSNCESFQHLFPKIFNTGNYTYNNPTVTYQICHNSKFFLVCHLSSLAQEDLTKKSDKVIMTMVSWLTIEEVDACQNKQHINKNLHKKNTTCLTYGLFCLCLLSQKYCFLLIQLLLLLLSMSMMLLLLWTCGVDKKGKYVIHRYA